MDQAKNIYPTELPLKRTNDSSTKFASFLDINIGIENGLKLSVYNKTDDFPFKVVRYCFADSNVHVNVGLGTFYSQLLRYARIANHLQDFERRVLDMFLEFLEHGYARVRLITKFFHFTHKFRALLVKLGLSRDCEIIAFVNRVFCR